MENEIKAETIIELSKKQLADFIKSINKEKVHSGYKNLSKVEHTFRTADLASDFLFNFLFLI